MPVVHTETWTQDVLDVWIFFPKDAAIAVSAMWWIWGIRNNYNHGEVQYQPMWSVELADELIRSLKIPLKVPVVTIPVIERWQQPKESWVKKLKINTDGAIQSQGWAARTGTVAQRLKDNSWLLTVEIRRNCWSNNCRNSWEGLSASGARNRLSGGR